MGRVDLWPRSTRPASPFVLSAGGVHEVEGALLAGGVGGVYRAGPAQAVVVEGGTVAGIGGVSLAS